MPQSSHNEFVIDARVVSREPAAPQSEAYHVGHTVALYMFPALRDSKTKELATGERAGFKRGKNEALVGFSFVREAVKEPRKCSFRASTTSRFTFHTSRYFLSIGRAVLPGLG